MKYLQVECRFKRTTNALLFGAMPLHVARERGHWRVMNEVMRLHVTEARDLLTGGIIFGSSR
jgi:hypothetical protein